MIESTSILGFDTEWIGMVVLFELGRYLQIKFLQRGESSIEMRAISL